VLQPKLTKEADSFTIYTGSGTALANDILSDTYFEITINSSTVV